ncbi:MAG: tyrosine-type recombinase/integrase [Methanobrevibacter sp.]|nr:tyrosine-type recombinase/integrase [Methanobrevibacter sp.]
MADIKGVFTNCLQTYFSRELIMEKQPFYLTKRTLPSGKKVWYYYYYNNFGERTVPKSTGETNKQKAFNFCIRLLSMNNLANKKVLFKDYAKDWFTPNCQWYKDKNSNRPIKKNTIVSYLSDLNVHLLPYFGNMEIDKIFPSHIKSFRSYLSDNGLSHPSINRVVAVMKVMMGYALDEKLIKENPVSKNIKILSNTIIREAFTLEEVKELLYPEWEDYGCWLFTLVGVITGMRISEINGLQLKQLHTNYIEVNQQYSAYQIQAVKTEEPRFVTCPEQLIRMMIDYCDEREFVFHGKRNQFIPMDKSYFYIEFRKHYTEEMKKRKGKAKLTFHSLRHFFNTYLTYKGVQEKKINFLMGHSTKKGSMFDLYTTWSPEMYKDVLEIQKDLLKELIE